VVPYYKHILAAPSFLSKTVIIISLAENIHNILEISLSSCATIIFLLKLSAMVVFCLFLSRCFYIPESCLYPAGSTRSHGFLVASPSKNRKQSRIPIAGFETDGQNGIFQFKRMDAISNHKFDELLYIGTGSASRVLNAIYLLLPRIHIIFTLYSYQPTNSALFHKFQGS
jgi:hypothetical protein